MSGDIVYFINKLYMQSKSPGAQLRQFHDEAGGGGGGSPTEVHILFPQKTPTSELGYLNTSSELHLCY